MKRREVLSAGFWLALTSVATVLWFTQFEAVINWRLAFQNWMTPLGALGVVIGFSLVNHGLQEAGRSTRTRNGDVITWIGYSLGLVSAFGFTWSWAEQGYHYYNMFLAATGAFVALMTLASAVAFVRSTKYASRPSHFRHQLGVERT